LSIPAPRRLRHANGRRLMVGSTAPVPAPPRRPRTSGWVGLGTSLAVIGAEITESVLHPKVAEGLAIADVAIPLIAASILFITIVWGSPETVDRVFRLLRWIANRPEPAAPDRRQPTTHPEEEAKTSVLHEPKSSRTQ
jgi:hypothetical protein